MLEILGRPGLDHNLFGFEQAFMGFFGINPEAPIIVNVIGSATPEPDDKAPFTDRPVLGGNVLSRAVERLHVCSLT